MKLGVLTSEFASRTSYLGLWWEAVVDYDLDFAGISKLGFGHCSILLQNSGIFGGLLIFISVFCHFLSLLLFALEIGSATARVGRKLELKV